MSDSDLKVINYDQLQLVKKSILTLNVSIIILNRLSTNHILRKL